MTLQTTRKTFCGGRCCCCCCCPSGSLMTAIITLMIMMMNNYYCHSFRMMAITMRRVQNNNYSRRSISTGIGLDILASGSSNNNDNKHDNDNNNDDDELSVYFAKQQQEQQTKAMSNTWYKDQAVLPFSCTSCGKCCQTKGNVWMSPEEVKDASDYLQVSTKAFIDTYASHTIGHQVEQKDELVWAKLTNNDKDHCIFLNNQTNQCQIYPVRPIQCSTYPFWTNILSSQQQWNNEVRIPDHYPSVTSNDKTQASIPYWSKERGGCEGMKQIPNDDSLENDTVSGVSPIVAYQTLQDYEREDRRFPTGRLPIVVERKEE